MRSEPKPVLSIHMVAGLRIAPTDGSDSRIPASVSPCGVKLPACNGKRIRHSVSELVSSALPEEPGAVIPHAGICEGGVGHPASLP